MEEKKYQRLTFQERVVIETLLRENRPKSFIAQKIGRARSTLYREIAPWVKRPGDRYSAEIAQWNAEEELLNRRNLSKLETHKRLRLYVYRSLLEGWSPEQIAGRIKESYPEDPVMSISHEAIYAHIYSHPQARLNRRLIALLPQRRSRRRPTRATRKRRGGIKDRVGIECRPEIVEHRTEAGHWEGDLIVGARHGSAIGTLVERKTRYTLIVKIKDKKSPTVRRRFARSLLRVAPSLRKTLTYDNGVEMAQHKRLASSTGMDIYFARPYASWERGTNENTNGLIRRFFPKGTNFNTVSEQQLLAVQDKLNHRPRKVLGFRTPEEALALEAP
jgi:IS30 family transposase